MIGLSFVLWVVGATCYAAAIKLAGGGRGAWIVTLLAVGSILIDLAIEAAGAA